MKNIYQQQLTVPSYYTDINKRLKPSAFMDMMQEMAYFGATELHFGYDDMQKNKTAWVLARMHFTFQNPPSWRDKVSMSTWHKGLDGLMFLRDFRMCDAEGNPLLLCTSSWLVINTETRRLVRSNEVVDVVPEETTYKDDAIVEPSPKITMPKGSNPEFMAEHKVAYSDLDLNGHTNNARYISWAMDCLDYQELCQRGISDVMINFNKETKLGENVSLNMLRQEEDGILVCYVEGLVEGKSAFCAKFKFNPLCED